MDTANVLAVTIAALGSLIVIFMGVVGWWLAKLSNKIDHLSVHGQDCIRQYADKADNAREHASMWDAINKIRFSMSDKQ